MFSDAKDTNSFSSKFCSVFIVMAFFRRVVSYSSARIHLNSFQPGKYAISDVACLGLNLPSVDVHPSATVNSVQAHGYGASVGGFPVEVNFSSGLLGNGVCSRNFTSSAHVYKRNLDDNEEEIMMDRHFNNPLNKYLDHDESLQKSLEEITREQKRKIRSAKYSRAAREFKQPPEKRTLSWDAIQQIQYLRHENPQEWSIASLAQSFNVSEEVIVKVLKSKFRPSEKARQKQDLVAARNTGYVQTGSAGEAQTQALVASSTGNRTTNRNRKENKKASKDTQAFRVEQESGSDERRDKSTITLNSSMFEKVQNKNKASRNGHQQESKPSSSPKEMKKEDEKWEDPEVEFSFGNIDFENVDNLMGQVKLKPQVFRKGRNFYNEHGEFLYRI